MSSETRIINQLERARDAMRSLAELRPYEAEAWSRRIADLGEMQTNIQYKGRFGGPTAD